MNTESKAITTIRNTSIKSFGIDINSHKDFTSVIDIFVDPSCLAELNMRKLSKRYSSKGLRGFASEDIKSEIGFFLFSVLN